MPELVIEGFAGPGGMSEALRLAGHTGPAAGIELDAVACRTASSAGHTRIRADVAAFPLSHLAGRVDGVAMSPPCQGFSRGGNGGGLTDIDAVKARITAFAAARSPGEHAWADPRSVLTAEPMRYVAALRPRWVVLEQAPAVLPLWEHIAAELTQLGYQTWTGILTAEQFGVPQVRRRAFLMARRDGRRVRPPTPTNQAYGRVHAGLSLLDFPPPVTMFAAVGWGLRDRPAWTVTGGGTATGGAEVFGNARCRARLGRAPDGRRQPSVRDAAVLQSFRPDYPWQGTESQRYQEVGNSVPPLLGAAVLRQFMHPGVGK